MQVLIDIFAKLPAQIASSAYTVSANCSRKDQEAKNFNHHAERQKDAYFDGVPRAPWVEQRAQLRARTDKGSYKKNSKEIGAILFHPWLVQYLFDIFTILYCRKTEQIQLKRNVREKNHLHFICVSLQALKHVPIPFFPFKGAFVSSFPRYSEHI